MGVGVEWGERSRWRAECQPGCYSVAHLPRAYIPAGKASSFLQHGSATSTLVFRGLAHQSVRRPLTDERSAAAGQCTASCCLSQSLTPSLHCQPLLHFWPPGSVPVSSGCFFGGPVIQFSSVSRETQSSHGAGKFYFTMWSEYTLCSVSDTGRAALVTVQCR